METSLETHPFAETRTEDSLTGRVFSAFTRAYEKVFIYRFLSLLATEVRP